MRNQIPKSYLPYDLYCNLVPNTSPDCHYYQQVPRTGAFEVSYKGHVSTLAPLARSLSAASPSCPPAARSALRRPPAYLCGPP